MTFSIVAYDPNTDEVGVAVHSKAFSVGSIVPFVKAGVGAVATQSLVNVSLGPEGIELMEQGLNLDEIIAKFETIDEGLAFRQLGLLSIEHGSFSFTGDSCIPWAGGKSGDNYAIQGNILAGHQVIDAMEERFRSTDGSLAERMVAALQAGIENGGDKRGKQSAAVVVEQPGGGRAGYGDRKIDIRVEDHAEPVTELLRLLEIRELNLLAQKSGKMFDEDPSGAISMLEERLAGRTSREFDETWLTLSELYYKHNQLEQSKQALEQCLAIQPGMAAIIKLYPKLGASFSQEFIDEVLS